MKRAWLRDDLALAGHGSFGKAWKPHRKPWNPDWMLLEATTKRVWAFREANQTSVFKMWNRGVNKIELLLLDSFLCGFHRAENESWREFTRSIHRLQLSHEALSLIFTSHSSKNLRANEHRSCWGAAKIAKCARSVWVDIPSQSTIWWNETLWQKYKNMLWCRLRNDVVLFHVCGTSCIGNAKDSVIASLASPSSSTTKDANGCTEKAQKKAASRKSSGEEWLLIKISRQTSPRNTGVYLGNSIWHNVGCRKKAPGLVAYLNVTIPEKRC